MYEKEKRKRCRTRECINLPRASETRNARDESCLKGTRGNAKAGRIAAREPQRDLVRGILKSQNLGFHFWYEHIYWFSTLELGYFERLFKHREILKEILFIQRESLNWRNPYRNLILESSNYRENNVERKNSLR